MKKLILILIALPLFSMAQKGNYYITTSGDTIKNSTIKITNRSNQDSTCKYISDDIGNTYNITFLSKIKSVSTKNDTMRKFITSFNYCYQKAYNSPGNRLIKSRNSFYAAVVFNFLSIASNMIITNNAKTMNDMKTGQYVSTGINLISLLFYFDALTQLGKAGKLFNQHVSSPEPIKLLP